MLSHQIGNPQAAGIEMNRQFALCFVLAWLFGAPAASADVRLCGIEFAGIDAPNSVVLDGRTISGERMVRRITNQICPRLKGSLWDRYYHFTFSDDEGSFFAYNIGHDYLIPFSSDGAYSQNSDTAKRFEIATTEPPRIYLEKIDAEDIQQNEARILGLIASLRAGALDENQYYDALYDDHAWIGRANTWVSGSPYNGTFMLNCIVGSENYKDIEANGMRAYNSNIAPYDFEAAYLRVNGKANDN